MGVVNSLNLVKSFTKTASAQVAWLSCPCILLLANIGWIVLLLKSIKRWKIKPISLKNISTSENNGCPDEPTDLLSFISNSDNRILFKASSSKLDNGDKETLDKLIALLGQYPTAFIIIEGHAYSDGSESFNQKLSEKRAASVKAYLLGKGIDNNRMSTIGYGESRPIGNNKTSKGRADSRRVNINRSANVKVN